MPLVTGMEYRSTLAVDRGCWWENHAAGRADRQGTGKLFHYRVGEAILLSLIFTLLGGRKWSGREISGAESF